MSKVIPMRGSGLSGLLCVALGASGVGLALPHHAVGEDRPATASTGVEMQFLDPRIPEGERRVLAGAVGYSLPALSDGAAWVGESVLDLAGLRGSVVVIQSYTRGDADGRAALRRTEDILKNIDADGLQLIALHTPEDAKDAASFYADKPPTLPTIMDRVGVFCDELGVYQRPVTIMIDRSGRIRYAGVAMAKLRPAVELLAAETFDPNATAPPVLPARSTRITEEPVGDAVAPAALPPLPPFPPNPDGAIRAHDMFGKPGPSLDRLAFMTGRPQIDGKVVMLEFWATWCGPCVKNIPHLNDLHKAFGDKVTIIGASDEDEQKIRGFMKNHKFEYAVARDMGAAINNALGVSAIPYAIIMSPDGIVRWQGHPAGLDEKTLQQIVDASGVTPGGGSPGGAKGKRWVTQS